MIGGRTAENPEAVKDYTVSILAPDNPAMKLFPKSFQIQDNLSPVALAADVRVLAESKGIPVVWTKNYGKGRVFVSQFGHTDVVWDRPDISHMLFEAIRWAVSR